MGITVTIEIYDEEDAINLIAAIKIWEEALLEYKEEFE